MKPHVLVAVNGFTEKHMERIRQVLSGWATLEQINEETLESVFCEKIGRSQIVVGWPKAEWLAESPVRLVQLGSVGYDAFLGNTHQEGTTFALCNAGGVMSVAVAEHLIAMMFALTRRISHHIRDMNEHKWRRQLEYEEVFDSTACIVGVGGIGTEIARRLRALGVRTIGVRREIGESHPYLDEMYPSSRLQEAVAQADHVILILPGNASTEKLFDTAMFASMKKGAYFYNLARGSIVDENALHAALSSGRLKGAGLDVFEVEPLPKGSPLWEMDNVIITPHSGGRSVKEFDRFCQLLLNNLMNFRDGKPFLNQVNL
ncbi:D-2-hydroxyacid dehydrogenase [Paenibacillus sp. HWE-109]|uniref:D-2-hydroxyacid dehydrogenase n=1 Tax=Paenibacillus sp. HWE-109 TaxID=1306526 RepID=UPI001EDFD5F7|nr:D-2-hydroxyacid dehydrogenase [Paenibacillus sp. HWE-109]UKS27901.1 D-2-hydroxyacid dehydrogenase [Paenibacillus sp. HWE-109]